MLLNMIAKKGHIKKAVLFLLIIVVFFAGIMSTAQATPTTLDCNTAFSTIEPSKPVLTMTNTLVPTDEDVSFSWQPADNADTYTLRLYQDGNLVETDPGITATSYTVKLKAGNYSATLMAVNSAGSVESDPVTFQVADAIHLAGFTPPAWLAQGVPLGISGTVSSASPLTLVRIVIQDQATGSTEIDKSCTWNTGEGPTSFDLYSLYANVQSNTLKPGAKTLTIVAGNTRTEAIQTLTSASFPVTAHTFYLQTDKQWRLPAGGCWITSYAMVFHNLGKSAIPTSVFVANGRSTTCRHTIIWKKMAVKPVDLRNISSTLFSSYDSVRGANYIRNSSKSESNVIQAIKLALDHHHEGVIVRFQGKPHSLVAIGYSGNTIYFDDPATSAGAAIPFERTPIYKAGFRWKKVTFIQAFAR